MGCSDTLYLYKCRENSTNHPFLCKTNPIFPGFSPENDDFTKKQTQFKPNSNPIQSQTKPILAQKQVLIMRTNPNKANFSLKINVQSGKQSQFKTCTQLVFTCFGVYLEFIPECCSLDLQQGSGCLIALLPGVGEPRIAQKQVFSRIFELTKRGKKDIIRFFKRDIWGLKLLINSRHR